MRFITSAHLVDYSCWPFVSSFGALLLFNGLIFFMFGFSFFLSSLGLLIIACVMYFWFTDMLKEQLAGYHNSYTSSILRTGMIFFILSEIFFFFGFFWGYFHSIFSIDMVDVSFIWNWSKTVEWDVPLFNTVLLMSSGVTLTWAHHELIVSTFSGSSDFSPFANMNTGKLRMFFLAFELTLMLGIFFLFLQWMEFELNLFSINSTIFGSSFYMLTGFHGMHVFVGVILLSVFCMRVHFKTFGGFNSNHLMMASWYWHFVDVVWLFLFMFLYPSNWMDFFSYLGM